MAKTSSTRSIPQAGVNLTEEEMSETEEYFQNTPPTSGRQSSAISFEAQNTDRTVDDGVTIGVLTREKVDCEEEFDSILLDSIDESLSSLGEPVKNAVYFHLQNKFGINKNDIPERILEFVDIIHKIFGSGAGRIEIKFMKTLNSKININTKWPENDSPLSRWLVVDMSFLDFVHVMRENYEANVKKIIISDQQNALTI